MRKVTSWIVAGVATIVLSLSTQSLSAASLSIASQSAAASSAAAVKSDASFPGYLIGIIGAGKTVGGLPAFPNGGELDIPAPLPVLPSGQPIQYYFSVHTVGFSGNLNISLQVIQSGVSIYSIVGTLPFDGNTNYVVSTNNAEVPAAPGAAQIMVTVSDDTGNTTSQGTRVVIH